MRFWSLLGKFSVLSIVVPIVAAKLGAKRWSAVRFNYLASCVQRQCRTSQAFAETRVRSPLWLCACLRAEGEEDKEEFFRLLPANDLFSSLSDFCKSASWSQFWDSKPWLGLHCVTCATSDLWSKSLHLCKAAMQRLLTFWYSGLFWVTDGVDFTLFPGSLRNCWGRIPLSVPSSEAVLRCSCGELQLGVCSLLLTSN